MNSTTAIVAIFLVISMGLPAWGDEPARREESVRKDRKTLEGDARWLYNDLETGFEAGKKLGKPVLVVLRCVPCKACTGLDENVLKSKSLQPLLDDFVCVRLISANNIDLKIFQFDYDLSFSILLFHPDGTLIGRYGSWQHQIDEAETSLSSLIETLNRATALFREWDVNRESMATKQGMEIPFESPLEIPGLAGKYGRQLNWEGNVVKSCVHCHQIGDAYRAWYRNRGEAIPQRLIYPMPDPRTVGIRLDQRNGIRIKEVEGGSLADAAGFRSGDEVIAISGAPNLSMADFAWALHRAEDDDTLRIQVKRGETTEDLVMRLPLGWRKNSDIQSRVGTWQMRGIALGGLKLDGLDAKKRAALGLEQKEIGLSVTHVGEYGEHAAAKKAGFRIGDVIVSMAGIEGPASESRLIGELLEHHVGRAQVPTTVLREGKRVELMLPVQ